jgi:RNA polymerase sigma-70 factor (ECF subfamily)
MPKKTDEFLPTRWSLLSRLKDWDDQESWRQFFDTYWQLIYSTAVKAGLSEAEAQDVVQEVIISVARKMGEFTTDPASGSFKSWLMNLTRWRITDQFRKRARDQALRHSPAQRSPHDNTQTATVERVPDPAAQQLEAEWEQEWAKNVAHVALARVKNRVKPEMFQLFDLLVTKQWPALKVARRLRVSLAQVYYAKYKVSALAKAEIRKLEKQGI